MIRGKICFSLIEWGIVKRTMTYSKSIATWAGLCLAVILIAGVASARQSNALVGKWKMVSTTDDGSEVPWNLSITYEEGKYGATSSADGGEGPVKDLKVDGTSVHFRVPYQGDEYDIDLKLAGNKLAGTWSGNGASGDTKGERAVAPEH